MTQTENSEKNSLLQSRRLLVRARQVTIRFKQLELQRFQEALRAFEEIERLDPELASLASVILKGRGNAASWFGAHIEASDIVTPWQCIAEGKIEWVSKALLEVSEVQGDIVH